MTPHAVPKSLLPILALLAATACASSPCPKPAATTRPAATTSTPSAIPATPTWQDRVAKRMLGDRPAKDAPAGLAQFGQLVGTWTCTSTKRNAKGGFDTLPGQSTWSWFYTLDGRAILDVFEPPKGSAAAVGVNLRVYNENTNTWQLAWTTGALKAIDGFTAKAEGDNVVMRGERAARAPFPAHSARITFHNISATSFSWVYEATAPGGSAWKPFSRIQCTKK